MQAEALAGRLRAALRPLAVPPADAPWNLDELDGLLKPGVPAEAAVLVGIIPNHAGPEVLLTRRSDGLRNHGGQVSFPGGRIEAGDDSPVVAALREAHEEVGLAPKNVEVLGRLPIYVTGTAFHITPVVALVHPQASYFPNPGEVADLFEVPLSYLLNPAHHERHAMQWQGVDREWFAMPYQDGEQQRYIWGATAGMLRNLYRFLAA